MPPLQGLFRRAAPDRIRDASRAADATRLRPSIAAPGSSSTVDPAVIAEGAKHFEAGRFAEAFAVADDALLKWPGAPTLLFARGAALFGWGRFHEALASFRRAAEAGLVDIDLDLQFGWSCVHLRRLDEAEAYFRKAVAAHPDSAEAYLALANVLEILGKLGAHAEEFEKGLARWQDNYDALVLLGGCRLYQGDRDGGIAAFRQAIAIDPRRPRAWSNLGGALDWDEHLTEATEVLQRAYELDLASGGPDDSVLNLATVLREQGRRTEALQLLERSLARYPDPNRHWLCSSILLESGHLEEGWIHHEFRWLQEPLFSRRLGLRCPVWSGQDLRGKSILLHSEQGYGDVFQFIRYARILKDWGARVLLRPYLGFDEVSRDFDGVDDVLVEGANVHFDYQIGLVSLPRVLGTTLESIPADVPYIKVRPSHQERWAKRIGPSDKFKVGLVWAGNPKHVRDRLRSVPLAKLTALGQIDGIEIYSLQKSATAGEDIAASGLKLIDLGPELTDFRDTAAAISQLDLIITVDTAVSHLAGALAKPVWMLVANPPDWRWLLHGERTPWYPTMFLFRQQRRNDWGPVVSAIERTLRRWIDSGGRKATPPTSVDTGNDAATDSIEPVPRKADVPAADRPQSSRVDETRYGIIQYLPNRCEEAESLRYYGEYRQAELDLMVRFIQPGAWVLEAGAGIGVASLYLSSVMGDAGHLIAYEPDRLLHHLIHQNLAANRVRNATLLRRNLGPLRASAIDEGDPAVAGRSDSDAIDELRLERLNWIRINDGALATGILAGAPDTLWRLRPWVYSCIQSEAELPQIVEAIRDFGYRAWRFEVPLFNPDNYNRRSDNIFPGQHMKGVLCVPEEVALDVELNGCTAVASAVR